MILATGIYHLFNPPAQPVALQHLHPDIWWPMVLLAIGLIFIFRHAPWRPHSAVERILSARENDQDLR